MSKCKCVRVNLGMIVMDSALGPYNPGRTNIDLHSDGAVSIWGDGDGQTVYLYAEQVKLLRAALESADHIDWDSVGADK